VLFRPLPSLYLALAASVEERYKEKRRKRAQREPVIDPGFVSLAKLTIDP